jgi:hypothetical protein
MICSQISEVQHALVQISPRPSMLDVTRVICGSCTRQDRCPTLSMEHEAATNPLKNKINHRHSEEE